MSPLLESGQVGNVSLNRLREDRAKVLERWETLGLLEGLDGYAKENVAQLFENQASFLINEATSLGAEGSFETVVFPIVRRVFSKLLANEIVSVQALNLPIGKLFYFIPKTGRSSFAAGSAGVDFASPDHGDGSAVSTNDLNLYDSFYGEDGLYDASKGNYTTVAGSVSANTYNYASNGFAATTATTVASGSTVLVKINFDLSSFDLDNVEHAEDFISSMTLYSSTGATTELTDWTLAVQKYGDPIMDASGNVFISLSIEAGATLTLADMYVTARNYEDLELNDNLGEVSFELKSVTVSVIERKLRAQWSPELAQDVSAFHNIDAEAELTALLSEQIAAEIDREILRDLRRSAAWRLTWDYAGSTGRGIDITKAGAFYTQKEWNQTLMTAINQISAQIHKATLRGGANWIVCSAEVSAILDDLEHFHVSNAHPEEDKYNMGIERVGSLSGRYQVYRDPYFPADKILIGHKGTSLLDTGYIYAPYVPLQLTPTMYNPFTFAPVKGIMTRYAKKLVNNRYYGLVKVRNIVSFSINALR